MFTLTELVASLRIPPRTLLRLINEGFGRNFSDSINGYRIAAAKDLFSDPKADHIPEMGIPFRVGFNAKSTLNSDVQATGGHDFHGIQGPAEWVMRDAYLAPKPPPDDGAIKMGFEVPVQWFS